MARVSTVIDRKLAPLEHTILTPFFYEISPGTPNRSVFGTTFSGISVEKRHDQLAIRHVEGRGPPGQSSKEFCMDWYVVYFQNGYGNVE